MRGGGACSPKRSVLRTPCRSSNRIGCCTFRIVMGAGSDDDKRRHDTCEEWKNSAMKGACLGLMVTASIDIAIDAYVRFMVAAMATAGCRIDASYFKCQPCDRLVGGGLYYDDDGNSSVK